MSFVVAQRTREIGLRMALGATRARVLVQVLREGMTLALVGAALGSVGAWFVAKTMQRMVYGVGGLHAGVFVATALTLLGVALAASLVPAWRAASVDPARALRQE
jgi:ABC-type antimicrobial peptide transport system permease subunit